MDILNNNLMYSMTLGKFFWNQGGGGGGEVAASWVVWGHGSPENFEI